MITSWVVFPSAGLPPGSPLGPAYISRYLPHHTSQGTRGQKPPKTRVSKGVAHKMSHPGFGGC